MIKTQAINLKNAEPMMVTWDVGRRCNYDCTYCPVMRHDTYSDFHRIDEYVSTFDFVKEWTSLYNLYRKNYIGYNNLSFTGGEPTINPHFWKLLEHINANSDQFRLSLTTNGTWNESARDRLVEHVSGVTVSYHTEAKQQIKQRVIKNILDLNHRNLHLQVNLMLHTDHWNECMQVYDLLKSEDVSVIPRPIGDEDHTQGKWFVDQDGSMRRTSHVYTQAQQEWFFAAMSSSCDSCRSESKSGDQMGRACCGGRCIQGMIDGKWQNVSLVDTHFKDWFCAVDWYFLHIDQHTGQVYHHQTCQAKHNQQHGSVGHLEDSQILIDQLKDRLENLEPIVCPNSVCGCGMCVPKAKTADVFASLWKGIIQDDSE